MVTVVEEPKEERTPRADWAGLLRRTFALDVVACSQCGGRRRLLLGSMFFEKGFSDLPWLLLLTGMLVGRGMDVIAAIVLHGPTESV